MFVSLDGVDGVGKSTQIQLLATWLEGQGQSVVSCRDPGSTELGEALRRLVLSESGIPIARVSEMLLYMAARAQLVQQVIRPALAAGHTVLCDRFLLANVVYQGHAGGLEVESLWHVGEVATGGLHPDLTLVLDMDADAAWERMGREPDRMEAQGIAYLECVRQGFLREAELDHERIVVIDARQSVSAVQTRVRDAVTHELLQR
jgi:dTMP kinase